MCDFLCVDIESEHLDSLPHESFFLISMADPWYGNFLLYLQTQRFRLGLSFHERCHIRHHVKHCLILVDTLYQRGIDSILRRCLTHDEVEFTLNDCH